MRVDYHSHHERCGHAAGSLEDYIKSAIEKGLDHFGISDHMPLIHVNPAKYYPEMAMPYNELPVYVEEAFSLREKYKDQIDIRIGIEGDFIEGYEEDVEKIVQAYPWDYVIGSVHFLGEWDITDFRQVHQWEGRNVDEVYRQYYDAVQKAARSGLYDWIGHFDVIKRFGFVPKEDPAPLEDEALRVIAEEDMAIELNTAGWYSKAEEMYPSHRILQHALRLGIPITTGADSHRPDHVGRDIERAYTILREIGFPGICGFKQRKRTLYRWKETKK